MRAERALESILAWGVKSWMAHAWYLERSAPDRWSLKANLVRDSEGDAQPQKPVPSEILARHRELMMQLLKEDAAKQALGNSEA